MKTRIKLLATKWKAPYSIPRNRISWKFAFWSFFSGCVSIWSILLITEISGNQLLIGSFGASAVLLFSAPDSMLTQPKNLIGGHLLSAVTAVLIVYFFGSSFFTIGFAVGLSILFMYLTHTTHPPGGATAIIGVMGNAGIDFIFFPVLAGVLVLLLNALLVNNFVHHRKYPHVWF